jgi:hypothetical protein
VLRSNDVARKHVFADLKPYVCTFEDCELRIFSDLHSWVSHELENHRKEWNCYFCRHPPFSRSNDYLGHVKRQHQDAYIETQVPALLELSQQWLLKLFPSECPFCDDWDPRLERPVSSTSPDDVSFTFG